MELFMKCIKFSIYLIILYMFISHTNAVFWQKQIGGKFDSTCAIQNNKLLSLLNLVCNATQNSSIQMRDACYGCFFRAGNIIDGPTQLYSLNDCARLYIQQTSYASCVNNLQAIVDGNRPTPDGGARPINFCYMGYCDFVRCLQRINTEQLIASCYAAALNTRQLTEQSDRIYFYTNITSCILARTRCSQFNPITGELQNQFVRVAPGAVPSAVGSIVSGTPMPFLNALQITDVGDVRVISFPQASAILSDSFCPDSPPLMQSGFGTYLC